MKKITRKETKTILIGVEMSGKEFVKMIQPRMDGIPIPGVFWKNTKNEIEVGIKDTYKIEGTVTILFNTDDWDEGLPEV